MEWHVTQGAKHRADDMSNDFFARFPMGATLSKNELDQGPVA